MSVLRVAGLRVSYRQSPQAYHYPSIQIDSGQCVAVIGPTGSGKSTLVNALFQPSFGGQVVYEEAQLLGRNLNDCAWPDIFERVSYLPQYAQSGFNPSLTVAAHLDHVRQGTRRPVTEWGSYLAELRLQADVLSHYPHQLSGGMKQRLMLMMGMIKDPALFVLDEPSTAVDAVTMRLMVQYLQERTRRGLAILLVSHERGLVRHLADEVLTIGGPPCNP